MAKQSKTWVKYLVIVLIIFFVGILTFAKTPLSKQLKNTSKPETVTRQVNNIVSSDTLSKEMTDQLVVYYFMTAYRCRSCVFIEETTRKTLDEFFSACANYQIMSKI